MHIFYVFGPAYVRVKIGSPLRHVPITSVILRVRIRARSMLPMAERRRPLALGRPSSSSRHISSATCTHIYCHWSETGTHPYLHKSATCTQPYFPGLQHAHSHISLVCNMHTALSTCLQHAHSLISLVCNMHTALFPWSATCTQPYPQVCNMHAALFPWSATCTQPYFPGLQHADSFI